MARIQHMNRGPPSAESPRPVFKVGSATKMKGDPYVKNTRLPNSQARRQLGGIESLMRMHISEDSNQCVATRKEDCGSWLCTLLTSNCDVPFGRFRVVWLHFGSLNWRICAQSP